MRIVQLSAGTGSFYCGSCMRDNALVAELRRQGHDALIAPLYLPMMLDEAPATKDAPLFFGGVNVYLQHRSALFRNTPRWLDRLFDSPRVLRAAAARAGLTSAGDLADLTLSMLRGERGRQVKELDRLADWLAEYGRPDVVCLSNALLIGLARRIRQRTGAAVVCTLQGEESFLDSFPPPQREAAWRTLAERAADVDAFIAPTRYYAGVMGSRAGIPPERLHVVPNGILLEGYRAAETPPEPPVIGFLARMSREKGLDTLVEAYCILRASGRVPGLKLRVAGSCTAADAPFVDGCRARLAEAGADAEFLPNLDRGQKAAFLGGLSALSVPATYGEAFGLYVVEALAAGVPVVQPRHGAFPELIEGTGGGILCEPDDPHALAGAIERLLADPAAARGMGERGRRAVHEQFGADRMAAGVLAVFERALHREPAPARG